MPRTGLPDLFTDTAEYERYVRIMVAGGAIPDASFLWWTLRPSTRYPTLELRVADSCTKLEDTLAIVRAGYLDVDMHAADDVAKLVAAIQSTYCDHCFGLSARCSRRPKAKPCTT